MKILETLMASRRSSKSRIYNTTWKILYKWCRTRFVSVLDPTTDVILDFLQDMLQSNLKQVILKRQVAALVTALSHCKDFV